MTYNRGSFSYSKQAVVAKVSDFCQQYGLETRWYHILSHLTNQLLFWVNSFGAVLVNRSLGHVSRKFPKLLGPEKSFVKLRLAYSVKLVFSYFVKRIKIKITSKFHASRRLCFEDTKRIMLPEMRPKHFGTFKKRAPGLLPNSHHMLPASFFCFIDPENLLWEAVSCNVRIKISFSYVVLSVVFINYISFQYERWSWQSLELPWGTIYNVIRYSIWCECF